MATKYSSRNINQLQGRKVFFDANVLIYVFWPSGNFNWENQYSSAFGNLLRQGNILAVDFMVLSEVINRAIKIEYEKFKINNNNISYKKYRDSTDGIKAMEDIYVVVKESILPRFTIIGKSFNKSEIESFLHIDSLDFNDKAIVPLCQENNCILLTNDKDFANSDIDIISSNPIILKA